MKIEGKEYRTIWFENNVVKIIDQTKLPHQFIIKDLKTVKDSINAIKVMEVRGAPLIGATAAYGMDLAIIEYALQDRKIFLTKLIIPSSNKDENFEEIFIREVFEIIKEKNIRVMPTAPQVRKFIKKNKEFKELLPIGVRL